MSVVRNRRSRDPSYAGAHLPIPLLLRISSIKASDLRLLIAKFSPFTSFFLRPARYSIQAQYLIVPLRPSSTRRLRDSPSHSELFLLSLQYRLRKKHEKPTLFLLFIKKERVRRYRRVLSFHADYFFMK